MRKKDFLISLLILIVSVIVVTSLWMAIAFVDFEEFEMIAWWVAIILSLLPIFSAVEVYEKFQDEYLPDGYSRI